MEPMKKGLWENRKIFESPFKNVVIRLSSIELKGGDDIFVDRVIDTTVYENAVIGVSKENFSSWGIAKRADLIFRMFAKNFAAIGKIGMNDNAIAVDQRFEIVDEDRQNRSRFGKRPHRIPVALVIKAKDVVYSMIQSFFKLFFGHSYFV